MYCLYQKVSDSDTNASRLHGDNLSPTKDRPGQVRLRIENNLQLSESSDKGFDSVQQD